MLQLGNIGKRLARRVRRLASGVSRFGSRVWGKWTRELIMTNLALWGSVGLNLPKLACV